MKNKHHEIARLAYELYEKRGCSPGYELEDWLEAERLILIQPVLLVEIETGAGAKSRGKRPITQTEKEKKPRKTTDRTTKKPPVKK